MSSKLCSPTTIAPMSYLVPKKCEKSIKVFLVLCGLYDTIKVKEFVSIRQNFAFIFSGRFPINSYRAQKTIQIFLICRGDSLQPLYMQTIAYNIRLYQFPTKLKFLGCISREKIEVCLGITWYLNHMTTLRGYKNKHEKTSLGTCHGPWSIEKTIITCDIYLPLFHCTWTNIEYLKTSK